MTLSQDEAWTLTRALDELDEWTHSVRDGLEEWREEDFPSGAEERAVLIAALAVIRARHGELQGTLRRLEYALRAHRD